MEWVPFPPLGDHLDPSIEPASPALVGRFFTTEPPGNLLSAAYGELYYENSFQNNNPPKFQDLEWCFKLLKRD